MENLSQTHVGIAAKHWPKDGQGGLGQRARKGRSLRFLDMKSQTVPPYSVLTTRDKNLNVGNELGRIYFQKLFKKFPMLILDVGRRRRPPTGI